MQQSFWTWTNLSINWVRCIFFGQYIYTYRDQGQFYIFAKRLLTYCENVKPIYFSHFCNFHRKMSMCALFTMLLFHSHCSMRLSFFHLRTARGPPMSTPSGFSVCTFSLSYSHHYYSNSTAYNKRHMGGNPMGWFWLKVTTWPNPFIWSAKI